jgi:hypothetical protein
VSAAARDRSGRVEALTAFLPINAGHESALAQLLDALPLREGSPLARVAGTHFARFVVLDAPVYEGPPQRRDSWKAARLLFTSNFDGPLERYLERLRTALGADGDAVFGRCAGYPGSEDARRWGEWLLRHRVVSSLFFAAYGDQDVETVVANVDVRARLIAFALAAQGLEPAELQAGFVEAFGR